MKKFCTKCGREFEAVGREVICPNCKAQAAEESKKAAVLRAKKASWTGESVPVRISGRSSTIIRRYGTANNLPFAQALDELLKSTDCFKGMNIKWDEIKPYKSHRRDKATSTTEDKQDAQEVKQDAPQEVKTAAKKAAVKPVNQAAKKAVKTAAGKKA